MIFTSTVRKYGVNVVFENMSVGWISVENKRNVKKVEMTNGIDILKRWSICYCSFLSISYVIAILERLPDMLFTWSTAWKADFSAECINFRIMHCTQPIQFCWNIREYFIHTTYVYLNFNVFRMLYRVSGVYACTVNHRWLATLRADVNQCVIDFVHKTITVAIFVEFPSQKTWIYSPLYVPRCSSPYWSLRSSLFWAWSTSRPNIIRTKINWVWLTLYYTNVILIFGVFCMNEWHTTSAVSFISTILPLFCVLCWQFCRWPVWEKFGLAVNQRKWA